MHEESVLNNSKYVDIIRRMIDSSTGSPMVTEKNVYQEGNPTNKPLLRQIVQDVMLPGSRIIGREHLSELRHLAQRRKACLVLMEHYSNFDIPCFYELLEQGNDEMTGHCRLHRIRCRGEAERDEQAGPGIYGGLHAGGPVPRPVLREHH